MKQFNVKKVEEPEALVDKDMQKLVKLVKDLNKEEEEEAEAKQETLDNEDGFLEELDNELWVDEVETMNDKEQAEYEEAIWPIKMVLVKVSLIGYLS